MSVRIGRNGDAEIQLTVNDAQHEVTNVRLISTGVDVFLKFFDGSGNVIFDLTLTAPLDQVINLAPAERPQMIEREYRGQTIWLIPYEFTTGQTQFVSARGNGNGNN